MNTPNRSATLTPSAGSWKWKIELVCRLSVAGVSAGGMAVVGESLSGRVEPAPILSPGPGSPRGNPATDGRDVRAKIVRPRGGSREREWGVKATLEIDDRTGVSAGITPSALALDATGNTYVAGRFVGNVRLGSASLLSGPNPLMFVTKLNRSGGHVWTRQGDTPGDPEDVLIGSEAQAVAVASDGGVVVAGVFSGFHSIGGTELAPPGSAFAARLSPTGDFLWVRQIAVDERWPSNGECEAAAVACDSLGNSYVAGTLRGTKKIGTSTLVSAGGSDAYVVKLDANGRILWVAGVGGEGDELGQSLAVNRSGEVWLAGSQAMPAGFDPSNDYGCPRTRAFVTALKIDGTENWTVVAAGDVTRASAVVVDSSNTAFLTGDFMGNATFGGQTLSGEPDHAHVFVVRINPDGRCAWASSTTGGGGEQVTSIGLDIAGNPYVSGGYLPSAGRTFFGSQALSGASDGGLFLSRLDRLGRFDWARSLPNSGSAWAQGIAVAGDGAIHLTGSFLGALQAGGARLEEPQSWNLFVARLAAAPPPQLRRIP